jgi:hypothetical protein
MSSLKNYLVILAIGFAQCAISQGYMGMTNRITLTGGTTSNLGMLIILPSFYGGIDYVKTLNRNIELGAEIKSVKGFFGKVSIYNEQEGTFDYLKLGYQGGSVGIYINSYLYDSFSCVAPIGFYIQSGLNYHEWHVGEEINMFGIPKSTTGNQYTQFSFLSAGLGFGQQAVWGKSMAAGWIMKTSLPLKYFREPDDLISEQVDFQGYKATDSPTSLYRYTAFSLEFSLCYFF